MSHLIDMTNARANMAYVGQTPWHGLGTLLTEGAPLDVWAREAGMSHTVERAEVEYGTGYKMPERHVLYRSDNKQALGVVSDRYNIVQPREILEFYRDLTSATGDYALETAGCLDSGKKYWALARYMRGAINVSGDLVKPYLLLTSSADGSMATTATHTTVRVVCNNTLQISLGSAADAIRVPHSTVFNADRVKDQLRVSTAVSDAESHINALVDKAMSVTQTAEFFVSLVSKKTDTGAIANEKQTKRVVTEIMHALNSAPGAGLVTAKGTAWGAMNAVTYYVDFKARARSDNNRFSSGQYGLGAELKRKALVGLLAA